MLASRSLRWSGAGISNGRQRLKACPNQARLYSLHVNPVAALGRRPRTQGPVNGWNKSFYQSRSISLFGWGTSSKPPPEEFATAHTTPQAVSSPQDIGSFQPPSSIEVTRAVKASHATSDAPDPSLPAQASPPYTSEPQILHDLENAVARPAGGAETSLDETGLSSIPEAMGYLKEACGLDYGWGPTAVLEYCLEHLHITAGLSWAAAIVTLAVLQRLVIFRFVMGASDNGARMRAANPVLKPLRDAQKEAMQKRDTVKLMEYRNQMQVINKEYGIKLSRSFIPLLVQMPLQFGAFRLLRGMATVPVPAFENESWLWTTDLALGDPYYLVPVVTSALLYQTIKLGSPEQSGTMDPTMRNLVMKGLPMLNLVFMCFQPGSVQLFFAASSVMALMQAFLMNNDVTRKLFGLYPMPAPLPTSSAESPAGAPKKARIVGASGSLEANVEPRSFLDKWVDGAKERMGKLKSGATSVTEKWTGTTEDRKKRKREHMAAVYEARRREELRIEREGRNMADRAAEPSQPVYGGMRQPETTRPLTEDVFEDEDEHTKRKPPRRQKLNR